MVATAAEVLDTTKFCSGFPSVFGTEIFRDNVLHTLDKIFEGETQLLIVDGEDAEGGIGKTVLLSQFARKHSRDSISIFIRSTSWFAYDPALILRDLCSQMHWILFGTELEADSELDDTRLAKLVYHLQGYSKRSRKPITFVVDGISEIPRDRLQIRDIILSKLPFGLPQFRFLFSGDGKELLGLKLPSGLVSKVYTLSPFSLDETARYFGELLPSDVVAEIFKLSHGTPGYLAAVRRLLDSGLSPADLMRALPSTELFAMEWEAAANAGPRQTELLAMLAHDRNKHTVADLTAMFEGDPGEIRQLLSSFTFLEVPKADTEEVTFVSETYREYAANRLATYRDSVNERVIDYLLESPDSDESISLLPVYLQNAGRDEALLSYLSPDHLGRMLEKSELLTPVQERTRIGIDTALRLRRDEDLMRLGVQSSVLSGIDSFGVSQREIEARLALSDLPSSISMAQSTVLKEDRLRLLGLIARKLREKKQPADAALLEQIEQLAKQVDYSTFTSDTATDLAADLMYCNPQLAIEVLEKASTRKGEEPVGSVDWAFARLSIFASVSEESELKGAAEAVKTHIKDPNILNFSAAIAALFGGVPSSRIIEEVEKINDPEQRLALLRHWAVLAIDPDNAAGIIEYALSLAIKTTQYSPNATHFRELATPLPQVRDIDVARRIIATLDTQRATIRNGPTEDFVRLELILAEAEAKYDFDAATKRLEEVYWDISYIVDVAIRTASLARLAVALPLIDKRQELEAKNKIHSVCESDLKAGFEELLRVTARQEISTRSTIEALAVGQPALGLSVCLRLNTEVRRDESIRLLLRRMLQQPATQIPFEFIPKALDEIKHPDEREEATVEMLQRLERVSEPDAISAILPRVVPLLGRTLAMRSARLKARAACFALQFLKRAKQTSNGSLEDTFEGALQAAWESVDEDWDRVDLGFFIAGALATCCQRAAAEYLQRAEALKESVCIEHDGMTYGLSARLAVRAYSGLLAARIESEEEFKELSHIIERLPSLTSRIDLWADLTLRCFRYGRITEGKRITDEKVRPLLSELEKKDKGDYYEFLRLSAPALYMSHPKTAIELLSETPKQIADGAYIDTLEFICLGRSG